MLSNFSFWIWGIIITQLLSAFFHSLSFIAPAKPRNDMEKQLVDITTNYKLDMGAGIKRSFYSLFIGVSSCFTLIFILGASLNWYFLKSNLNHELWKGLLLIQLIVYGIVFLLQVRFTFLPPIILTGLVFIFLIGAYFIYQWP
ncbi:LIC_13387 family protein [Terrimonas pollutisoli]|uniref:LIC_13387 family protein n=1 Tax=Terrimonas pollutisoli TaxID=3034147 RepID=UPI0023EAE587|nr:hypothetical protein [Terrimonas sp. H1YJ31]